MFELALSQPEQPDRPRSYTIRVRNRINPTAMIPGGALLCGLHRAAILADLHEGRTVVGEFKTGTTPNPRNSSRSYWAEMLEKTRP